MLTCLQCINKYIHIFKLIGVCDHKSLGTALPFKAIGSHCLHSYDFYSWRENVQKFAHICTLPLQNRNKRFGVGNEKGQISQSSGSGKVLARPTAERLWLTV